MAIPSRTLKRFSTKLKFSLCENRLDTELVSGRFSFNQKEIN